MKKWKSSKGEGPESLSSQRKSTEVNGGPRRSTEVNASDDSIQEST